MYAIFGRENYKRMKTNCIKKRDSIIITKEMFYKKMKLKNNLYIFYQSHNLIFNILKIICLLLEDFLRNSNHHFDAPAMFQSTMLIIIASYLEFLLIFFSNFSFLLLDTKLRKGRYLIFNHLKIIYLAVPRFPKSEHAHDFHMPSPFQSIMLVLFVCHFLFLFNSINLIFLFKVVFYQ